LGRSKGHRGTLLQGLHPRRVIHFDQAEFWSIADRGHIVSVGRHFAVVDGHVVAPDDVVHFQFGKREDADTSVVAGHEHTEG